MIVSTLVYNFLIKFQPEGSYKHKLFSLESNAKDESNAKKN